MTIVSPQLSRMLHPPSFASPSRPLAGLERSAQSALLRNTRPFIAELRLPVKESSDIYLRVEQSGVTTRLSSCPSLTLAFLSSLCSEFPDNLVPMYILCIRQHCRCIEEHFDLNVLTIGGIDKVPRRATH